MKTSTLTIYPSSSKRSKKLELRWKLTADNNEIIGASTQGFNSHAILERNLYLNYMPSYWPSGPDPLRTLLAFRQDWVLEDLTVKGRK